MTELDSEIQTLVDVLRSSRERITTTFEERARARLPVEDLSERELRDRLPQLLEGIAHLLASPVRASAAPLGEAHTADRLRRGFDIALVLREYELLRECVVDAWESALGEAALPSRALRRLDRAFGNVTAQAASRHREELERHLRALKVFVEVGTALAGDLEVALAHLAERTLEAIGSAARVTLYVTEDDELRAVGHAEREPTGEDGGLARLAARGRSMFEDSAGDRTRLAVPLVHDDAVVGVAEIVTSAGQVLLDRERLLARAIANRATAIVAHGRLAQREESTASHLAEAGATLRAVFDYAPVGLAVLNPELRYVRVNATLAAFNGRSVTEHLGRARADVVPLVALLSDAELRRVMETGEPMLERELTAETPARPGEARDWSLSAFPVSVNGRRVGIVVRDITEQKRAERALSERVRQRAALAELGLRALRATDLQTVFDDASSMLARTLSTDLAKILEHVPARRELVLRAGVGWDEGLVGRATVSADRESQAGYTLLSRSPILVEDLRAETRFAGPPLLTDHGVISGMSAVIDAPGEEGQPFGVLGTHTRQRRTFTEDDAQFVQSVANVVGAAVLRARSEARLAFERSWGETQKLLADVSRVLAGPSDPEARMREVVRALAPRTVDLAVALLRRPDGTLACVASAANERGPREPDACEPSALPSTRELESLIDRQEATRIEAGDDRLPTVAALFETSPRSVLLVPVRVGGAIAGALLLGSVARRLGEVDLSLAAEIGRRWAVAVENDELYRRTVDAVRAREDVLSVVSHDLRSPLHTIQLASASLRNMVGPARQAQVGKTLQLVDRALLRMRRLIDDLLDFDSIRAGRLSLVHRSQDPRRIVAEAVELFRFEAEERSLRLTLDEGGDRPDSLCCDADRVLQCLANLVGNALRVTLPGGTITLGLTRRGDDALFWVRDTGPGIAPRDLARIFERHWRGATGTYVGSGLGLAICRGIVEAHGGRIWAESVAGRGSTFSFTIPGGAS